MFYYGLDLDKGPPSQTCLIPLRKQLFRESEKFGVSLIVAGVIALIMLITHVSLYVRPFDKEAFIDRVGQYKKDKADKKDDVEISSPAVVTNGDKTLNTGRDVITERKMMETTQT